jgi:acyl-CoA reductase-like NAD-dependent aldehyde dehydrogenase
VDHAGPGFFVAPTILTDVDPAMQVFQEEIFGPVLVATSFETEDEAVELSNNSIFGLAASIWTRDVATAHRVARRVEAGSVWINGHHLFDPAMPFGGFKQSGWGRENGAEVLDLYTEKKTILAQL